MDERDSNAKRKKAPKSASRARRPVALYEESDKHSETITPRVKETTSSYPISVHGATTVNGVEAAMLDARIASKHNHGHLSGTKATHKSKKKALSDLEADINAKVKSKDAFYSDSAQGGRTTGNAERFHVDTKVTAKPSIRKSKPEDSGISLTSSRSQIQTLESDMTTKYCASSRGDTFGSSAAVVTTIPGARAELTMMEDEVTAKARGMSSRNGPLALSHPVARQTLDDFENSVTSSSKSRSTTRTSPHTIPSNTDKAAVSHLDDRIDAKIRGASVPQVTEHLVEEPNNLDELDYTQLYKRAAAGNEKGHMIEESAPPMVTSARGMINEPEVEFGTYGGAGHGYINEGLAIALAIEEEEEEEAFIPAAIQYNPDAKPPLYKNRRVRLYSVMTIILLIVIVAGVTVGVMTTGGGSEQAPTLAPTSVRDGLGIHEQITAVVQLEAISIVDSPQSLAMDWIINKDPAMLQPGATNLIQRYLLALFYISTTQLTPWLSCNPPVGNETSACLFQKLVETFPNETYEGVTWTRWLSAEHECTWAGIFCDEFNQTRAIELCKCPSVRLCRSVASLSHTSKISQNVIPSFSRTGNPRNLTY
jgi:hypothetical protein